MHEDRLGVPLLICLHQVPDLAHLELLFLAHSGTFTTASKYVPVCLHVSAWLLLTDVDFVFFMIKKSTHLVSNKSPSQRN